MMTNNENMSTPPQTNLTTPPFTDALTTPVGDHDKKPKIQLCLEIRKKEVTSGRRSKNTKKIEQTVLEVTVMWVKHLPQSRGGKRPNPFVKLRLLPEDEMQITELHLDKNDAQYIEVFTFPLSKTKNLDKSLLEVKVCENKATRNAKQFGNVSIALNNLKLGQPSVEWHHLKLGNGGQINNESKVIMKEVNISTPKSKKTGTKRMKPTHPPKFMDNEKQDVEGTGDDVDEEIKENMENLKISKSKGKRNKALPIHSDQESEDED